MIALKDIKFDQKGIHKDNILKHFDEYFIFRYYFPDLKLGKNLSPLRAESTPSFLVTWDGSKIQGYDFTTRISYVGIFNLLMAYFDKDFKEIINKVADDLGLTSANPTKILPVVEKPKIKPITPLNVQRRDWTTADLNYWAKFKITRQILEFYDVAPIKYIFFGNNVYGCDPLAYVYKEVKDGIVSLKTYQPYSKTGKWFSNNVNGVWEGWTQLKDSDTLIWTKSRKDVMSIVSTTDFAAISLQSETNYPKLHVVEQLKSRYPNIYILYDNDPTGIKMANELQLYTGIKPLFLPVKDYSTGIENKLNMPEMLKYKIINNEK